MPGWFVLFLVQFDNVKKWMVHYIDLKKDLKKVLYGACLAGGEVKSYLGNAHLETTHFKREHP